MLPKYLYYHTRVHGVDCLAEMSQRIEKKLAAVEERCSRHACMHACMHAYTYAHTHEFKYARTDAHMRTESRSSTAELAHAIGGLRSLAVHIYPGPWSLHL